MYTGMFHKGDEIWQYYLGNHYTHGKPEPYEPVLGPGGWICRLVQRLDDFISADADYKGAEFITPTLTFSGPNLQLNVACSALGEVWVELLDGNNVPITGYTFKESVSVDRNQIAAPVTWREHENVGELLGKPVKLRACALRLPVCVMICGPVVGGGKEENLDRYSKQAIGFMRKLVE